jgi:polyferredoxin
MENINRSHIRTIRYIVQWVIFAMIVYAGFRLYLFAGMLEQGIIPVIKRPPSVEGFMPIGALMSLKLWITEGIFDPTHPAALVIFSAALLLAVMLKKSFCSLICPVGTLSDGVWKIGRNLFGRNFRIPGYIDYPLRSIKYLLMAFFIYAIIIQMNPAAIAMFMDTPYWKISDIKLLKFFTNMSTTTMATLILLFVFSLFYKNFWCRYLCPYGGLLGLLSMISPVKIRRDASKCIDCGLCSKNCPSLLPVDKKITIRSPECTGCQTCVSYCPAKGALDMNLMGKRAVKPEIIIGLAAAIFFGLTIVARITGKWHSSISYDELLNLMPLIDILIHP